MKTQTCGCQCHEIEADDSDVIVFQCKRWKPICAVREAVRLLGKAQLAAVVAGQEADANRRDAFQLKLLKNQIEDCICPLCFHPVGKDWVWAEGAFNCRTCVEEQLPTPPVF